MNLRSVMQAGPTKVVEMFARLAETPDTALKTRERLFIELKAELEKHLELEEKHLFPALRRQPETKELVATAIRDNKDLRTMLNDVDTLAKNDEAFLPKLADLQKAFRQHARDEKRALLPAVLRALSEEQVQGIVEKMEESLAEADQARQQEAEERRAAARREREEREQAEQLAEQEQQAEQERHAAARRTEKAARDAVQATAKATEATVQAVAEGAQRATATAVATTRDAIERTEAVAANAPRTAFTFWDAMFGLSGTPSSSREVAVHGAASPAPTARELPGNEEVIPLAEEVLVVGKRTVNTGTTRIRRYVVETPVEQQVTLTRERVVVERRRPVANKATGETLTELTIEVVETDEVPVVAKSVQLREEIVIRTERTEHVETVRETVRQDEIEIEPASTRQRTRARG
jgi:uncharacterized protein (TIGR02271 family)